MKKVITNEYIEIKYEPEIKAIVIKWLPENQCMSELEFHEQLNTLFTTAEVLKADKMLIDANDFSYPISQNSIKLIENYVNKSQIKTFGLVKSQHLLGKAAILRLISKIDSHSLNLKLFNDYETGQFWLNLFSAMNKKANI